jgi:cytoskeletal protein CcmA (bactofilin family)
MFGDNKDKKSVASQDNFSANTIQSGTIIKGEVNSEGNIRIDGKLEGSLDTQGKLVVGNSGVITGDVNCQHANIEGRIEGKLEVNEMLILKRTAVIKGDITTRRLVVEEGAVFNGNIAMGVVMKKSVGNNHDETAVRKEAV